MSAHPDDKLPQLLTTKDIAEDLRVTRQTVTAWIRGGLLPASELKTPGATERRNWRIAREDFKAFKTRVLIPYAPEKSAD
jgi:excisionase family DNA binding protein